MTILVSTCWLFLLGFGIYLGFVASVVIDVQPSLVFVKCRPGILIEHEHCLPSSHDILLQVQSMRIDIAYSVS